MDCWAAFTPANTRCLSPRLCQNLLFQSPLPHRSVVEPIYSIHSCCAVAAQFFICMTTQLMPSPRPSPVLAEQPWMCH